MRLFDIGARPDRPEVVHDRLLTVPNLITLVRLAGLPVFAWLALGGRPGAAFWVLVGIAGTDWVDGYVARRFDQVSRLGKVLDPLVDRVLLATAGVVLIVAGLLPVWLVVAILARDVAVVAGALVLFGAAPPIPVTRTGKFATACLLAALPAFLLAAVEWRLAGIAGTLAWIWALTGLVAYYVAAGQYARRALALRGGGDDPRAVDGR